MNAPLDIITEADVVVSDLITVLRHAEREHQRLNAGGGR